ncbi:MAG: dipeptidase [Planctomycetota bacterium]|jgi:membrane dipeptidase
MNRRNFLSHLSAGLAAGSIPGLLPACATSSSGSRQAQDRRTFLDAMGEIRVTHSREVLQEVIASGTRAVMVTLTDPKVYGEASLDAMLDDLAAYDRHIAANSDLLLKATSVADIELAERENKIALLYLIQNSIPLQRDVNRVDMFHSLGIRSIQVTYNYQNLMGSGCHELGDHGLTVFGREVIERMNEVSMLIDTSHANMRTMAETIRASKQPTIISHTGCQAVHSHIRNTSDENLRLLAEHGGVVGVCQIRPFLTAINSDENVSAYFDHIEHAVKVAGIDHVCIGSDRDHRVIENTDEELRILLEEEGSQLSAADWPLYMPLLNGPRRMEVIWDGLGARGMSEAQREKIMHGNLWRIWKDVIG